MGRNILLEIGGGANRYGESTDVIDPVHPYSVMPDLEPLLRRKAQAIPWPFEDNEVTHIYAAHVMEHIPSGTDRINVFNECFRVLQPGGYFDIIVPLVGWTDSDGNGHLVNSWHPYADPTHVSYWWFPESLLYFCEGDFKAHAEYGIQSWRLESWKVNHGFEGLARLQKI